MSSTISPNMGLIVPGVGSEPGPAWANEINASLGTIDQHNHSPGQGVKITPLGLDINADLSILNNNIILVKTINFSSQVSSFPGVAPNLGAVYVAGNELYYNDEVGNVVQITNLGSVNAGAGSITGLPSGTASVSYSAGNETYVFQSATSTPANIDAGSVILREVVANANGITLSSPSGLVADYQVFFPAALPPSIKFLTLDNAGTIADVYDVDNSTIEVSSNLIQVKNAGITAAKLAPGAAAANIGPLPFAQSANSTVAATSSQFFIQIGTGLTVTLTTAGNPVSFQVLNANAGAGGAFIQSNTGQYVEFLLRNVTTSSSIGAELVGIAAGGGTANWPSSSLSFVDATVVGIPGTYTWELLFRCDTPGNTVQLFNSYIFAYEL